MKEMFEWILLDGGGDKSGISSGMPITNRYNYNKVAHLCVYMFTKNA